MKPRLLLIDNYDSFTYNLVQAFLVLGAEVDVHRNDALTPSAARALAPSHLCISPGPGTPRDAGVSMDMIREFAGRIPVLGVCLGHQSIVAVFGGEVVRAGRLMHGKTSLMRHDGRTLFARVPQPCEVGRYHSLIAEPASLPAGRFASIFRHCWTQHRAWAVLEKRRPSEPRSAPSGARTGSP